MVSGRRGCNFWLPKKKRFCANPSLSNSSKFCGNHTDTESTQWIQCPIDPSHNVLVENLEGHKKKCPLLKQSNSLSLQPFYHKGINAGSDHELAQQQEEENKNICVGVSSIATNNTIISSEMKRSAVFSMTATQFSELLSKIRSLHASICADIPDSYKIPQACDIWINRQIDRKIPFQEKHVQQQASILGNLEDFGVIKSKISSECDNREPSSDVPEAVVEFGAGRGYLTQVLADCYGFNKVLLVERKSYKLKADRSLRQKESLILERLRIDIEDLNLNAVESLQSVPYLAIGKHLCGPATDMTLRCCLMENHKHGSSSIERCRVGGDLRGLAIATCCHHLCQWKHYINKSYLTSLGINKEEFNALTWFTSWAVDADHSSDLAAAAAAAASAVDHKPDVLPTREKKDVGEEKEDVEEVIKKLRAVERAAIGFMCKDIIDMGRLMWLKQHGLLQAQLVKYVPSNISPENHLLIAKPSSQTNTI